MGFREYVDVVRRDRPVLYAPCWEPGTAFRDWTARSANGAATGAITQLPGPFGGPAVKFPGSDDNRIEFADANHLDVGNVFSLEGWYMPVSGAPNLVPQVCSKGFGAYSMEWGVSNTRFQFNRSGNANLVTTAVGSMVAGVWYYLVGTKTGATRKGYINGTDRGTGGSDSTCADNVRPFMIGASQSTTVINEESNGRHAHVAVYNYVLSPAQIRAHWLAAMYRNRRGRR